jgi:hypothetical protein
MWTSLPNFLICNEQGFLRESKNYYRRLMLSVAEAIARSEMPKATDMETVSIRNGDRMIKCLKD